MRTELYATHIIMLLATKHPHHLIQQSGRTVIGQNINHTNPTNMSPPQDFKSSLEITHITTATAIIDIDGVKFITDPVFAPSGTEYEYPLVTLRLADDPAIPLNALPAIDAVLLSHEDHEDNLDDCGRRLLDGRKVITTPDGAKKLSPRPDIRAIQPWQTLDLVAGGKAFKITGIPAIHLPGGECTGFVIQTASFGHAVSGLPNAIYFSGDTIYHPDLLKMNERWHVVAAILNLGNAQVSVDSSKPEEKLQITMGGKDGARLVKELDAETLIPMHYKSWGHFTEGEEDLVKVFEEEGIEDRVRWLTPSGKSVKIF
jgi:L-ascorbate metabolism protein UlaG (beta-lactamase superfamily)